jgi:hypothetical protein
MQRGDGVFKNEDVPKVSLKITVTKKKILNLLGIEPGDSAVRLQL